MKLKSIKKFLDCKESIIRMEIIRYLLNRAGAKLPDEIFNRSWVESDILLGKEIKKLANLLTDDVSDYEIIAQVIEQIADRETVNTMVCTSDDIAPVDGIINYIKQDIEEKLPN